MVAVVYGPIKNNRSTIRVRILRVLIGDERIAKEYITERVHRQTRVHPSFHLEPEILTATIELQGKSELEIRAHVEWAKKFLDRALQVECSTRYQENLDSL